jgi:hypothetical protein
VIPLDGVPHFERTPSAPLLSSNWMEEVEGVVNEAGTLDAKVTVTARGDAELPLRQAFVGPVESVWPFTVQGVIEGIDRKADKVVEVKITDPTSTNEPFKLSFRVTKPGFVDLSKSTLVFNSPFAELPLPTPEEKGITDARGDWHRVHSEPVNLGPRRQYTYRMALQFANQSTVPAIPQSVTLNREYAAYKATYSLDHNTFLSERTLDITQSELPAETRVDYREFREKVLADLEQRVYLRNTGAPQR